jgi:hypothetical protein
VLCSERDSAYTTEEGTARTLELITRSSARQLPVCAVFRLKPPHLEAEPVVVGNWQEALLHTEEVEYMGEGLASILGRQRLAVSKPGSLAGHPATHVGGVTYTVGEGVLANGLTLSGN